MITDSLGDMLTRIRNGAAVGHATVAVPASGLTKRVAVILKEEGYLDEVAVVDAASHPMISLTIRYKGQRRERQAVVSGLERVSKPGKRVYCGKDEIPRVLSGMGIAILSTPKGVMTGSQARRLGVGGEVLCYIY